MLNGNLSHKTHYETIGVKENASHEEIRKTYRSVILNKHPDKLQKTLASDNVLNNEFIEVQKAWNILADPRSRALYDNELRTSRQDTVNAEDVRLEDMEIEDCNDCFELSYSCRCGDFFSVDSSELAEMGYPVLRYGSGICLQTTKSFLPVSIVLPCGSCSLKIRLLIDAKSFSVC